MRAKSVRELVKIVEESNISELEISRWWGTKIRIVSGEPGHPSSAPPPEPARTITVSTPEPAAEAPAEPGSTLFEIKSPMVGTFYRAPAPEAEPYIKENDTISPGKVLCIIEAMKLMNEIEAEVSGKIVKVLAENAQPVEYNQPLFLIEPL